MASNQNQPRFQKQRRLSQGRRPGSLSGPVAGTYSIFEMDACLQQVLQHQSLIQALALQKQNNCLGLYYILPSRQAESTVHFCQHFLTCLLHPGEKAVGGVGEITNFLHTGMLSCISIMYPLRRSI